jgi:hypothetical protein
VVNGDWHGKTTARAVRRLPEEGVEITTATLPSSDSLPDPDCWVRRTGAQPIGQLGTRLSQWSPEDVALVVEVSEDTVVADLNVKARIYGSTGYLVYWVVTADVIYEHTEPTVAGYRKRIEYRRGNLMPVTYAGTEVAVDDLLGPEQEL